MLYSPIISDFVFHKARWVAPIRADINANLAGNNVLVAGVALTQILVLQYVEVCNGAVVVTWLSSGGTVLDGPTSFIANGGAAPPFNYLGHFQTLVGEDLIMNLVGAGRVGGHLVYIQN